MRSYHGDSRKICLVTIVSLVAGFGIVIHLSPSNMSVNELFYLENIVTFITIKYVSEEVQCRL